MAAYIDLNPIRAGMVQKPEDYKWCSYGEAVRPKNNNLAQAGLSRVIGMSRQQISNAEAVAKQASSTYSDWDKSHNMLERYRMMLFSDGEEVFTDQPETGDVNLLVRKGFKRKQVKKVLACGGKLTFGETLRCRVRYFSDGMTVGSREFVDHVFLSARDQFSEKRTTGARPMRGIGWKKKGTRLYSMRQLAHRVLE
jgi:putative transposase